MYKTKRTTIICFAILHTNTDYRWESEDGDVLETGRVRRRVGAAARHLHFRIYCGVVITLFIYIIYLYIIIIIYKLNIRYLVRIDFIK